MTHTFRWRFPLPRTHTGMLQGNGVLGVMAWGGGDTLNLTFGRADFWDHRGGIAWKPEMNYAHIRALLEAGDEKALFRLFEDEDRPAGLPRRPSVLPLGRLEIRLPGGDRLAEGELQARSGEVRVRVEGEGGREYSLLLNLAMDRPLFHLRFPADVRPLSVRRVAAWEYVGEYLKRIGFRPPAMVDEGSLTGWIQERPADPPLCLGYHASGADLWVATAYGDTPAQAKAAARNAVDLAQREGVEKLRTDNDSWWYEYWRTVPRVDVPNPALSGLYHYGMYKFAGLTHPDGAPATLQGPWIEEYQMPPWSSDYHFNINVQMCYWPAYRGNLPGHLQPLFRMIRSWLPVLRENARLFIGAEDGLALPHAVDDRCTGMGGFWTGAIDHGCTAWVAHMLWMHYRYTGDREFLAQFAFPFMEGAMRVYEGMLERHGDAYSLPVSVSPEYRGAAANAWGRNASFQLACIHSLCEALEAAAAVLGREPRHAWGKIRKGLPKASLIEAKGGPARGAPEIALWEGTPLEESHRHHSHLAGIYPFDTLDLDDPAWREIAERSLATWIHRGMGQWSGWCVPWAAIIHSRLGNGAAAELLLELWERLFTNEGRGTLHDPAFPGLTLIGSGPVRPKAPPADIVPGGAQPGARKAEREIMQIEAGMAAAAAVLEMLLHTRRGVHHVFAGIPERWKEASFSGVRTEGAFLVGAQLREGKVTRITIRSEAGGRFRLANPWGGEAILNRLASREALPGSPVLEFELAPGELVEVVGVGEG